MNASDLNIKIYADGADLNGMLEMNQLPFVKGFTTNPTLMRSAGVEDYTTFAKELLSKIKDKPISFEVFADDFETMEKQARLINSWGENVYIKIPVTNTKKEPSYDLIKTLSDDGVKLNVTAIMTHEQVKKTSKALSNAKNSNVSVFAGRIADTGVDPIPHMKESLDIIKNVNPNLELIWASPRELLNIIQAEQIGCDIITVTNSVLKKLVLLGKDLEEFSLDTVKMFYNDAQSAGYTV